MKARKLIAALLGSLLIGGTAQATLIDRGGGLIYDDVLNVTWLQDTNLTGKIDWTTANAWAANLYYFDTVRNVIYTDWRLPTMLPANTTADCNYSYNNTNCGYNVDPLSSELAHLFYVDAGRISPYDTSGNYIGGSQPPVPRIYWTGTDYAPNTLGAWHFDVNLGHQFAGSKANEYRALAVRDGDVAAAVPEPGTLALLGLALGAMVVTQRRRRRLGA